MSVEVEAMNRSGVPAERGDLVTRAVRARLGDGGVS